MKIQLNNKILTVGVLTMVAIATVVTYGVVNTYAYQGDATVYGPNHTEEREAAMDTVMANKDYEGWKALMVEGGRTPGVLRKIDTQAKFEQFAAAHVLTDAGKIDEANAIKAELGLGIGSKGQGKMNSVNGTGNCGQMF